jgi:SNF2 family DNA or RNA helicase
MKSIESENIQQGKRRGLILKLLTQTKQICNHPFQYLHIKADSLAFKEIQKKNTEFESSSIIKSPSSMKPSELKQFKEISAKDFINSSMKLKRLFEMLDEILEEGEKVLIFTQFKQMGDLLKKILTFKYNFNVGWLHGGTTPSKRRKLIDNFQFHSLEKNPILILSLRAGGTGLNLTRASTVFHFDRWWNPAVEDQATDRAYRIGQEQRVNVYKFIASGTIEERIDTMLEQKRDLAESIIGTKKEMWITELSNQELREIFSLSQTEVA